MKRKKKEREKEKKIGRNKERERKVCSLQRIKFQKLFHLWKNKIFLSTLFLLRWFFFQWRRFRAKKNSFSLYSFLSLFSFEIIFSSRKNVVLSEHRFNRKGKKSQNLFSWGHVLNQVMQSQSDFIPFKRIFLPPKMLLSPPFIFFLSLNRLDRSLSFRRLIFSPFYFPHSFWFSLLFL